LRCELKIQSKKSRKNALNKIVLKLHIEDVWCPIIKWTSKM